MGRLTDCGDQRPLIALAKIVYTLPLARIVFDGWEGRLLLNKKSTPILVAAAVEAMFPGWFVVSGRQSHCKDCKVRDILHTYQVRGKENVRK